MIISNALKFSSIIFCVIYERDLSAEITTKEGPAINRTRITRMNDLKSAFSLKIRPLTVYCIDRYNQRIQKRVERVSARPRRALKAPARLFIPPREIIERRIRQSFCIGLN